MKTRGLCIGAEEKDYVIIQLTDSLILWRTPSGQGYLLEEQTETTPRKRRTILSIQPGKDINITWMLGANRVIIEWS